MALDPKICDRARLARDPRFDGLFFTGVHSTGIFCRPVCPAPAPNPEHIIYYPSAAAAMEAGLRPCLRCRPEAAPGSPAWNGASTTVARALMLIRQGALNEGRVEALAGRLGVGGRHLRRLFKTHLGVSPLSLAIAHKVLFAKKLIHETDLSLTEIALASGFGSIRRFNAAFNKIYALTPSQLRRGRKPRQATQEAPFCCTLALPFRPSLDWETMLAFFGDRAIPGVECTQASVYYRTIRCNTTAGVLAVARAPGESALTLRLFLNDSRDLSAIVERVRRMFDLDANMTVIQAVLKADPVLAPLVRKHPGLRLPGAWDPFETAVRAVTGQQVSVKAARTVLGRIAAQAGPTCANNGHAGLNRFFPTPEEILAAPLAAVGMPGKRVAAIKHLAEAVVSGAVNFEAALAPADFVAALTRLPGIGQWTAQYIAMRARSEPDAFPADDLGLKRALQQGAAVMSRRQILDRAQAWRPWRAYAAIHLWNS